MCHCKYHRATKCTITFSERKKNAAKVAFCTTTIMTFAPPVRLLRLEVVTQVPQYHSKCLRKPNGAHKSSGMHADANTPLGDRRRPAATVDPSTTFPGQQPQKLIAIFREAVCTGSERTLRSTAVASSDAGFWPVTARWQPRRRRLRTAAGRVVEALTRRGRCRSGAPRPPSGS